MSVKYPAFKITKVPNVRTDWMAKLRPDDDPRGMKFHAGLDVSMKNPVTGQSEQYPLAQEDGLVVDVERAEYGKERSAWRRYGPEGVAIKGDDSGLIHWNAHLKGVRVEKGGRVKAGDILANGVESGKYPHVHWEVRTQLYPSGNQKAWQITIDPALWIGYAQDGIQYGPRIRHAASAVADLAAGKAIRPKLPYVLSEVKETVEFEPEVITRTKEKVVKALVKMTPAQRFALLARLRKAGTTPAVEQSGAFAGLTLVVILILFLWLSKVKF